MSEWMSGPAGERTILARCPGSRRWYNSFRGNNSRAESRMDAPHSATMSTITSEERWFIPHTWIGQPNQFSLRSWKAHALHVANDNGGSPSVDRSRIDY